MEIPKTPVRPRTALYRIQIEGKSAFLSAHYTIEDAREHAQIMSDLGASFTVQEVKKCVTCLEVKLLSEFSVHGSPYGCRQSSCMVCARERARKIAAEKKGERIIRKLPPIDSALVGQFLRGEVLL